MNTAPTRESIYHVCKSLGAPYPLVVRAVAELGIVPVLVWDGVPQFSGQQAAQIADYLNGVAKPDRLVVQNETEAEQL